ncbi:MAG: FAD-dependent oxidoreductase [Rhodospirillales bacterium]|nr:FAD-dependent oxidoreductase [Rhodospirillales bacterium]
MSTQDPKTEPQGGRLVFQQPIFGADEVRRRRQRPSETVIEPAQPRRLFRRCDVLVVGGGPAGTAAAIAAARLGAEVVLLERYNHLGGLSTGGLVIWIDRMTDWSGRRIIRGIAEELLDRLPGEAIAGPPAALWGDRDAARVAHWKERTAAFHGVVTHSPTIDPERLKLASQEMVLEAGAHLVLHGWGAAPLMEEGRVGGVFFESKEGRQAIRAAVTIDCTGDGDIFHRAGAASESDIDRTDIHHCMNTGWLFADVDMKAWIAFRQHDPAGFSAFMQAGREAAGGLFERPFVSWRDDIAVFLGPRIAGYSAVDVEDQTEVEIRSHRLMQIHLDHFRAHAPGFSRAYMMLSAPQLGVRHSRRLVGAGRVARADWDAGAVRADEIGVSPSLAPHIPTISVPYGCLVPARLDGLLAAGRHVSCDPNSHSFLREIPQCWMTGHAAGVAAALAAAQRRAPRDVPIAELQAALRGQGACLSPVPAPVPADAVVA